MNVVFDGENLLIRVNNGVTTLDIQIDVYSTWKEWIQESDNSKFLPALRTIGGDPTIQEKIVAPSFFLMNGWKIKPASWNHTLNLVGNLFVDEPETYGSNIVVSADGSYTVLVNMSTTSDATRLLVGSGVTQKDKSDIAGLINPNIEGVSSQVSEVGEDITKIREFGDMVQSKIEDIENVQVGGAKVEGDILTIYDCDDPTKIHRQFRLVKDADGRIVERVPL